MDFDYMNFRHFKKYNCYDDPIEDEDEEVEDEYYSEADYLMDEAERKNQIEKDLS